MHITPHIVVDQGTADERTYYVTTALSGKEKYGIGDSSLADIKSSRENMSKPGATLARAIEEVPGVQRGLLEKYGVRVVKSPAYSWHETGPAILGRIVAILHRDGKKVTVSVKVGKKEYKAAPTLTIPLSRSEYPEIDVEYMITPFITGEVRAGWREQIGAMLDRLKCRIEGFKV